MHPVTAYIALGANLGDREGNIRAALARLRPTPAVRVTKVSGLIENAAVGGPAGSPAFLNGAVEVVTTLSPQELMRRLLEIEAELGRERRQKWGPRTIDLDLLLYGDSVIDSPGLTVPHPRMGEREFVLGPLAEIAPEVMHPVTKRSVREMLDALRKRSG
jgi:2-amino-4-hydroxy-6-hydroxymethyldihydropteridine diphosphokinase